MDIRLLIFIKTLKKKKNRRLKVLLKNELATLQNTIVLSQSESKDLWLTVTVVNYEKTTDIDVVYLPTKNTELVTRQKAPEKKKINK